MAKDPRVRKVDGHKAAVLIDRVLEDYCEQTQETFFKAMSNAGKRAKKDLQATNAFEDRTGEYRKGWSIRTKREMFGINVLIYNRLKPSLTHLLEKGHATKNGTGRSFRDTPPHSHFLHAQQAAEEYLLEELTRQL